MNDLTHTPLPQMMVSRQFLIVAPENPRSEETIDDRQIEELIQSIVENGLLTPLIAYQEGHNFYVTAGGRRTRAIQALDLADEDQPWPVTVLPKTAAIQAGHAEQLAHVAMDEHDELRLFRDPAYANLTDAQLAARLGRSPRYVAQRREILSLPEPMVEAALGRSITIDQAIGLTYAKLYPDTQADFFARALKDPRFDAINMRNLLSKTVRPWMDYCHSQLVTRDEYIAAGGKLQEDLFTNDPLVINPEILLQIATEKARDTIKERYPDAFFVRQADDDEPFYAIRTHPGVWGLTPAETEEWKGPLSWWQMNNLQTKAEADDSAEDYDEDEAMEAQAELDRRRARKAELEPRATYTHPPALSELLGVVWTLTPGPVLRHNGEFNDPITVKEHVLPTGWADLEELQRRGFIDPPEPKPEKAEVALEDKISAAHAIRIDRVRTHALRMELSKSTDHVLKLFAVHLSGKLGRSVCFSIDPEQAAQPDADMAVTWSSQWSFMESLASASPDEIRAMPNKLIRDLLAYRILMCLTLRNPQAKELDAATIRRWWTPDAAFLSAYSKPQLLSMLKAVKPEDDFSKEKRGALSEILGRLVAQSKDFLPFGF